MTVEPEKSLAYEDACDTARCCEDPEEILDMFKVQPDSQTEGEDNVSSSGDSYASSQSSPAGRSIQKQEA